MEEIVRTNTNGVADGLHGCNKFNIPELIIKKRNGGKLSQEELEYFVESVVKRTVQDAQLGAMLMAIFMRHLDNEETTSLTRAMTNSGEVLSWPREWRGSIVDKHSTGGVGDKVSLVLAPALAACGVKVPMVSGRGLSHTGGTLDKLESIPGFNVSLSNAQMTKVLEAVGCCIVGQTNSLVPADKIMYATRDVTGTVDSIGLITASIISKKAAESLDVLVLDVKVGRAAFAKTEGEARELATRMVNAGNGCGVKTVALLTEMDHPIGRMVGNSLEVAETIACLHGDESGTGVGELIDLVVRQGGQLLYRCGKAPDMTQASRMISESLHNGSAMAKFSAMLKAQGVSAKLADSLCSKGANVMDILPKANYTTDVKSHEKGYVHDIDAMGCAVVSGKLGAGRTKAGEPINFGVGIELCTGVGKPIDKDTTWVRVHHDDEDIPVDLMNKLRDALVVGDHVLTRTRNGTRVIDVIT